MSEKDIETKLFNSDISDQSTEINNNYIPVNNSGQGHILPGQNFHGLLIHSVLGEGAMGSAYLASHPILQVPLVIKTFKVTGNNIFKEAHLAARVVSTNVVGVIDAGKENGIPFVVQRYVDGIDLAELVRYIQQREGKIPLQLICRIIMDAAMGLHTIHQAGVIHRDVKPANLFLAGNGVTSVGDFGIAEDSTKVEDRHTISGTPMFMAPEQWQQAHVDRQTDIYALGATAHLLATGKPPFLGTNWTEQMQDHLNKIYTPPLAAEPAEAYFYAVIEKMLRKDPLDRFLTGEEVTRVLNVISEPLPRFVYSSLEEIRVGHIKLTIMQGELCEQSADVIVNAANTALAMRLGVAKALRQIGGDEIEQEAMAQAPVAMGDVVWTQAGKLKATKMAHAVAAINGAICLQRTTLRVLLGAELRRYHSVAFPALGTGIGEVPMDLAAKLMLETIRTFAMLQPQYVHDVRIVLYNEIALTRWLTILRSM